MDDKVMQEISKKLNVLISLVLRRLLDDTEFGASGVRKQRVGEIARYLAQMGLDAKDIAQIVGAPLTSVRTLLTPSRRK